jgi:hypothetical protein
VFQIYPKVLGMSDFSKYIIYLRTAFGIDSFKISVAGNYESVLNKLSAKLLL